jgi:hypothetical protein
MSQLDPCCVQEVSLTPHGEARPWNTSDPTIPGRTPSRSRSPRPERRTLPETEARILRVALGASASIRRHLHPETGIPCWALTDGSILPRDPECGGRCEHVGTAASERLTRTLGRAATDESIRAWAPHVVGRLLGLDTVPEVPRAEREQLELDGFVAMLRGAADRLRPLHGTGPACWPRVVAGRIEIVSPEGDPCGGACAVYAAWAIRDLTDRYGEEDRSPARCRAVAASKVTDAERVEQGAADMYVRLDRLDPDRPGNFAPHPDRPDRPLNAPAWFRDAIPDTLGRRRIFELLRHARNNDPVRGKVPWPIEKWADQDGLDQTEEFDLIERVLDALTAVDETWVEDNVWRPLAAKPQVPSGELVEQLSTDGDAPAGFESAGNASASGPTEPGPTDRDEDIVALLAAVRVEHERGLRAREAIMRAVEAAGGTVGDLDELEILVGEMALDADRER